MQTVPVQNAFDMMLQHDVTRIVSGKSKGGISEKRKGRRWFLPLRTYNYLLDSTQLSAWI